jgi:hypothetical protein
MRRVSATAIEASRLRKVYTTTRGLFRRERKEQEAY